MTMKIRITNESAGSHYEAKVKVINCSPDASEEVKAKANEFVQEKVLKVGESSEFWLHTHQHVTVEEVQ